MTKEMIIREFRGYTLDDKEITAISNFYSSGASLLAAFTPLDVVLDNRDLILTMNNLKAIVTQIMVICGREKPNELH